MSGSIANFVVIGALLKEHERVMSLHVPHGGHIRYYNNKKK